MIDHLVLPVEDLATARKRLGSLGFTVAPDARHPFGTANACVFFADGTYLEPLAVASAEECAAAARAGNQFVARDQAFRSHAGEGLSAIAFATDDAEAEDRRFNGEGVSAGAMLAFGRPVTRPDGSIREASFRLAFAAVPAWPDVFAFFCQRISPLAIDRAALATHENGVLGLKSVTLAAENPQAARALFDAVIGAGHGQDSDGDLLWSAGSVEIGVRGPARVDRGGQGPALVFAVDNLGVTRRRLGASGIAFESRADAIIVPPAPGQGLAFIFEEA